MVLRIGVTSVSVIRHSHNIVTVLTDDVRKGVPSILMFTDDIVLCGDDDTGLL